MDELLIGATCINVHRAVESVDVVLFERRVRGKVEAVVARNGCDRAGLLLALQDGLDPAEVASGSQDAAFVSVVASQYPEAVSPGVVNDVVDVTDGTIGKCVGDAPGCSGVGGRVDVDFVAGGIVEIFSPVDCATGNCSDVQRARAADDRVREPEFGLARTKCNDRSRNGSDESAAMAARRARGSHRETGAR